MRERNARCDLKEGEAHRKRTERRFRTRSSVPDAAGTCSRRFAVSGWVPGSAESAEKPKSTACHRRISRLFFSRQRDQPAARLQVCSGALTGTKNQTYRSHATGPFFLFQCPFCKSRTGPSRIQPVASSSRTAAGVSLAARAQSSTLSWRMRSPDGGQSGTPPRSSPLFKCRWRRKKRLIHWSGRL